MPRRRGSCGIGEPANEDNLLMSQVERTPDAAKARADEWKATAIEKGFTEVKGGD